jgi:hypothetical protein
MSEAGKSVNSVEATPGLLVAAGIGAFACGSVAVALGRQVASSPAMTAVTVVSGLLLGALVGGVAAMALASRALRHSPPGPEPASSQVALAAAYLEEHLGQDVTAFLSGLDEPKKLALWASGEVLPDPLASGRLLTAYEAAHCLVSVYDEETAQAWFFGMNPRLGDRAPAHVLRQGHRTGDWGLVIPAAKEFVESSF